MTTHDPEATPTEDVDQSARGSSWATAAGLLFIVAGLGLAALVLYRIYPDAVRTPENPSFVDNIFANNLVVFAARLVLFSVALVLAFAAVYVIWSIVHWFRLGQWLIRAGPFHVSQEAVDALRNDAEFWRNEAFASAEQVAALTERVEQSDKLIDDLYELLEARDQDGGEGGSLGAENEG